MTQKPSRPTRYLGWNPRRFNKNAGVYRSLGVHRQPLADAALILGRARSSSEIASRVSLALSSRIDRALLRKLMVWTCEAERL
jgi:hypothetical protein